MTIGHQKIYYLIINVIERVCRENPSVGEHKKVAIFNKRIVYSAKWIAAGRHQACHPVFIYFVNGEARICPVTA